MINPARDVKGGKWEIRGGELLSDETWGAHIRLPYQPPDEYDCRISFTKLKPQGKLDGLNLWLPRRGRTVAWVIGGWGNRVCGLEFVKGLNPSDERNPTGVKRAAFLKIRRKHTLVAKVRKDSVKGYLDGELITDWQGDWNDLDFPNWVSRRQLEIATYSLTIFHSIELLHWTLRDGWGFGVRRFFPRAFLLTTKFSCGGSFAESVRQTKTHRKPKNIIKTENPAVNCNRLVRLQVYTP